MSKDLGLGEVSIDSLKIRVALSLCTKVDSKLSDRYVIFNYDTGDIVRQTNEHKGKEDEFELSENDYKIKAKTIKEDGITLHVGIEKKSRTSQFITEDCIYIKLSAKALKKDYFKGIREGNFRAVFDYIMSKNLFSIDYDTFLEHAKGTDIDFKVDFELPDTEYKLVLQQLADSTIKSPVRDSGHRRHKRGIEFSKRETTNYLSKPFFKVYHKGDELREKSNEFKESFLSDLKTDNIVRLETTVKNNKHLKQLGIKDNTLKSLLGLSTKIKHKIITNAVNKHVTVLKNELELKMKTETNITPMEIVFHNAIAVGIEKANLDFETISTMLLTSMVDPKSRYRTKKKLREIYEQNIQGKKVDLQTQKVADFFKFIQWGETA